MKRYFLLIAFSFLFLGFCQTEAQAQCTGKELRKMCKDALGEYTFESASTKSYISFGPAKKEIDATFTVFSGEKYRVVNMCDGFKKPVEFEVYNTKKQMVFNSAGKGKKFDFTADDNGEYTIKFKFPEGNHPNGCVTYTIGYKM